MQKFAVFKVSDESFGIAIGRVVEILKVQKLFSIPGLPDFLSGVMNVRGTIVPIIDLRRRFGMKPSGKKERLIIVRFDKEQIGFHVDEINEILALADQEIFRPPSIFKGFKTEYMTGLGKRGENIIILLNIDNILTSEEKIILKESLEYLEVKDAGTGKTDQ
jgi:purine-binding chemotaxis protein CheW